MGCGILGAVRSGYLFSIGLICAACSLFPEVAPDVGATGGSGGNAGAGGGVSGTGGTGGTGAVAGSSGSGGNTGGGTGGVAGTGGTGGTDGGGGCGGTQTKTLEATRDTYIVNVPPGSIHGTESILEVLTFNAFAGHRALVAFDVGKTTLPSNAKLEKATFELRVVLNDGATQDVGAHRIQKAWTEAGASWSKFDGASSWTKEGGDFLAPSAQVAVGAGTKVGDTLSWDVTKDVAGALTGANADHGWLLKPLLDDPLNGEKLHFASREATDSSARPKLQLAYVVCP